MTGACVPSLATVAQSESHNGESFLGDWLHWLWWCWQSNIWLHHDGDHIFNFIFLVWDLLLAQVPEKILQMTLTLSLNLEHIPIQFRIPMRSGRYLTINLEAQLETIFMAFIFCKISKLKYRNWFNVHLQCSPVGFMASLTIVLAAYSCYAFTRLSVAADPILIQVQVQLYLVCSLHFPRTVLAHLFCYKLVFIGNKKLYASLPPENNW